jgi:putative molybdopterin biosynthesis protein
MTAEQGKLYTLQEVADILRVTKQTLYNNIRKGKLQANKVGKEYRITEEQLQDIVKNGYSGNGNK